MTQCLDLVKRAAEIAQGVTWEFGEVMDRVKDIDEFTIDSTEDVAPGARPPQQPIKYVFKNAKGASYLNRVVHVIAEAQPELERWYSPALCGERPKAGAWGWDTAPDNELSCAKCEAKLKAMGLR